MTAKTTSRSFPTQDIADSAANLARAMGYLVTIERTDKDEDNPFVVTVEHTPEVDRRFQDH